MIYYTYNGDELLGFIYNYYIIINMLKKSMHTIRILDTTIKNGESC